MARASSVVLTSKKLSIAPSTHIDAGAELSEVEDEFMEEAVEDTIIDPASQQLLQEQDRSLGVYQGETAVNIHGTTDETIQDLPTGKDDASDDQRAQKVAAILNTCSSKGKPGFHKVAIELEATRASPPNTASRKRRASTTAPVSPKKRSAHAADGPHKASHSGTGKLQRPASVYDNLNKGQASKMKAKRRFASGDIADASSTVQTTKPAVEDNTDEHAEQERQGIIQQQRHGSITSSTVRERMPKKTKGSKSANQLALETRSTRSTLRNTGGKVAFPDPDWSKKPEYANKKNRTDKRLNITEGASGRKAQDSVQIEDGANLAPSPRKPATIVKQSGTRGSSSDGVGAVEVSAPRATKRKAHDHNNDGQNTAKKLKSVQENKEGMEDEGRETELDEELVPPSRGEAEESDEFDASHSDRGEGDVVEIDGPAQLYDNDETQERETDGPPQVYDNDETQERETAKGKVQIVMPFGQQANWNQVLKGAKSVGVSRRKGVTTRSKPKLATETITELTQRTSALKKLYTEYGALYTNRESLGEDSIKRMEALREQLPLKTRNLESLIIDIHETDADPEAREMIRDIYTYGIPRLVFLLRSVLSCYVHLPDIPDSGIKCIIQVQEMMLLLCKKASKWVAEPNTDRPIKRPMRQFIFPSLRQIHSAFVNELQQRERTVSLNRQDSALKKRTERDLEAQRVERKLLEREIAERFERVKAGLARKEREIKSLLRLPSSSSLLPDPQEDTTSQSDSDGESDQSIAREAIFGPRVQHGFSRKRGASKTTGNNGADNMAVFWSMEEREKLLIGLQIYQGPDRYEKIHKEYAQPGQLLQNKSFDDLVQKAREEKSNVEGWQATHGGVLPDWFLNV